MNSLLATLPVFKDVNDSILRLIEPLFELYHFPAESSIFMQNDIANHLYLLVDGAVDVVYKPYDSPPMTIAPIRPGNFFGWSAVIGNIVYTSSAICQEDCEVLRVSGRKLRHLCKRHPTAGRIILQLLADSVSSRWANAQEQIQTLLNQSVSRTH